MLRKMIVSLKIWKVILNERLALASQTFLISLILFTELHFAQFAILFGLVEFYR
jgi:hypothetical protein